MLDDGDRRRIFRQEFRHELVSCIGIIDVVIGKLLALKQRRGCDARTLFAGEVKTSALMRVFAIPHLFLQRAADGAVIRCFDRKRLGKPVGNHRIIGGGAGIGLGGKTLAQRIGCLAVIGLQGFNQIGIVRRIGNHRDIGMVLGGSADHRRAANIDVLHRRRIIAALGANFLEGIEIDDREIDCLDAVRLHRLDMLRIVPDGQKPAMDIGMQRLDAAVHYLGKIRYVGDIRHQQACFGNGLRRSTGRQKLDAKLRQNRRQLDNVSLVGHGKKRRADFDLIGGGDFLGHDGHQAYSV